MFSSVCAGTMNICSGWHCMHRFLGVQALLAVLSSS